MRKLLVSGLSRDMPKRIWGVDAIPFLVQAEMFCIVNTNRLIGCGLCRPAITGGLAYYSGKTRMFRSALD